MIEEHTKAAILALVAVDGKATTKDREDIVKALNGGERNESAKVFKFCEVARMIGVHRNTVANLVHRGVLVGVTNGSTRLLGVTEKSIFDYINKEGSTK